MLKCTGLVFLATLFSGLNLSAVYGQQENRQLGSHQHGHGQFNVVIEGNQVIMELLIPGHGITGFEHKPSTPVQVAAMHKAITQLNSGLTLFVPSVAARCKLVSAKVETAAEEHDDGDEDEPAADKSDEGHMEFHANYRLDCNAPERLKHIRFDFFKRYPSTQALEVMIISSKGQRAYNITAANPVADMPTP